MDFFSLNAKQFCKAISLFPSNRNSNTNRFMPPVNMFTGRFVLLSFILGATSGVYIAQNYNVPDVKNYWDKNVPSDITQRIKDAISTAQALEAAHRK